MEKGIHARHLKDLLLYGGVSDKEYRDIYPDMMKKNASMVGQLSALCFFSFGICIFMSHFISSMNVNIKAYCFVMVAALLVNILAYFLRHHQNGITALMYGFAGALLLTGLLLTLVDSPKQLTITLVPISVMIPLFYDDRPWKVLILIGISDLIYLLIAPFVKPAEIIIQDAVNVIMFSFAGIMIGAFNTKYKLERYMYAHELQVKAVTDELTGCKNRSDYEDMLHDIRDGKVEPVLGIIMLDLNGLKKANDELGHKAGDEMIVATAEVLMLQFAAGGTVYRIGGDEFAVMTKLDRISIDNKLKEVDDQLATFHGEYVTNISVAYGSITSPEATGLNFDDMIKIADKQMYEHKAAWYSQPGRERRRR